MPTHFHRSVMLSIYQELCADILQGPSARNFQVRHRSIQSRLSSSSHDLFLSLFSKMCITSRSWGFVLGGFHYCAPTDRMNLVSNVQLIPPTIEQGKSLQSPSRTFVDPTRRHHVYFRRSATKRKQIPWVFLQNNHSCMSGYHHNTCLLYTSPSPRDLSTSRMPSSA